jgi:nucleoside-diphosphate kinase
MQRTFVLIKPDAFRRGLVGQIMSRLEDPKRKLIYASLWNKVPFDLIEEHYAEHRGKDFIARNNDFMSNGQVLALIYEGENVIKEIRALQGTRATPGTIRGDFSDPSSPACENALHASDSVEAAEREILLWLGQPRSLEHELSL